MKAVLIGSDFIKTPSGDFKLLEINTNTQVISDGLPYLDFSGLKTVIQNNNFSSVQLIYPYVSKLFADKLQTIVEDELGLTFIRHGVASDAITVPYVEDSDDTFILRISYDTTAIIDDTYCRDKVNTQKLIHNQTFGCATYISGSVDDFSGLTELTYTGSIPNFIVKKRLPAYDREIFPTLYRVQSLDQLNTVKSAVADDEYLQEFVVSDLIDGKRSIVRSVDILYGTNLDVLNLGSYRILHRITEDIWETTYSTGSILDKKDRPKYLTYYDYHRGHTEPYAYVYDVDQEVLMGDTTRKPFEELQVGEVVKAIHIEGLDLDESTFDYSTWSGSLDSFNQNFALVDTTVKSISTSSPKSILFIKITVDDGTIWHDLDTTKILIKEDTFVRFTKVNDLEVGDTICTYNATTGQSEFKVVTNLEIDFLENKTVGFTDVEPYDLYLPFINENNTLIQHNTCKLPGCTFNGCANSFTCGDCQVTQCGKA